MAIITQKELKSTFRYNPEKGTLTRRSTGKVVGSYMNGYVRVYMKHKSYLIHRLVWLYHYGEFPKGALDHINSKRHDNRIENLREASYTLNAINIPKRSHNTSGVTGVSMQHYKWHARISDNRKNIYLGLFASFADAVKARYAAELRLGYNLITERSSAKQYLEDNNLL